MRLLAASAPDGDVDLAAPTEALWSGWLEIVRTAEPSDDRSAIIVRHPLESGEVYATVFGQLIAARPGELRVDFSMTPWTDAAWTTVRLGATRDCGDKVPSDGDDGRWSPRPARADT